MKCLNPKCEHQATTRGLCPNCYGCARRYVTIGKTTWQKLEKLGRCAPAAARAESQSGAKKDWLLSQQNNP